MNPKTNREIYAEDPGKLELLNNGVAKVLDSGTVADLETLRYEIRTFVCGGQYEKGLRRILDSYLGNLGKPEQPAVWVSGFYGNGKSHLVKMLRALWVDFTFPDGARARGLAHLPDPIKEALKELATEGKRRGGLHAAAGTLGAGVGDNVRMAILSILFKSLGLPDQYPLARFVMWLRDSGHLDKVRAHVTARKKVWEHELQNMYVSPVITEALLAVIPDLAPSAAEVRSLLKTQYPNQTEVTTDEMLAAIDAALAPDGKFPCTLIALDEVQQYIGDNSARTLLIQEVTEACSKRFAGQLVFVATGQTALSGTPQLQKLKGRFTVTVELSDQDVETVIRQMVLKKKPECIPAVGDVLMRNIGEISRHLVGTAIAPRPEDQSCLEQDYPLLPVRRRFWEKSLRALDQAGTAGQLRYQLKIVHEAARANADLPLGTVVPADFLFDQLATNLLGSGVLPREIYDLFLSLRDGTDDGLLKSRLCGLIFVIGKLPREHGVDIGVHATAETLADLLIENLSAGSADLRKRIPTLLEALVDDGRLMVVEGEYRLQTRESSAWETDYRGRLKKLKEDGRKLADLRTDYLQTECRQRLASVKPLQGNSKVPRACDLHFGADAPKNAGTAIPIWVRDGWTESEKTVESDARAAGDDSPTVFVFIAKGAGDELDATIAILKAADETLQHRGIPTTSEGQEALAAMESRKAEAESRLKKLLAAVFREVRVLQAGGQELVGIELADKVRTGCDSAMVRLFPQFDAADHPHWANVIERVRKGDGDALKAVGHGGTSKSTPSAPLS